jgi:hypothetical protein
MKKEYRPEFLGVFDPVGHVVVSFPPGADVDAAVQRLDGAGFPGGKIQRYSPEEMQAQAGEELQQASPMADFGQELNLVRSHGHLARQGYSFLVVHAPKLEQAQEVAAIVQQFNAHRAQRYGRLIIEEMIEVGSEARQTFE